MKALDEGTKSRSALLKPVGRGDVAKIVDTTVFFEDPKLDRARDAVEPRVDDHVASLPVVKRNRFFRADVSVGKPDQEVGDEGDERGVLRALACVVDVNDPVGVRVKPGGVVVCDGQRLPARRDWAVPVGGIVGGNHAIADLDPPAGAPDKHGKQGRHPGKGAKRDETTSHGARIYRSDRALPRGTVRPTAVAHVGHAKIDAWKAPLLRCAEADDAMTDSTAVVLADQLLAEGIVTAEQYEAAVHRARSTRARIEDALVDVGAIDETELLKYLARKYRTRFVVSQKLGRIDIEPSLLELVPLTVAESLSIFPLVFDTASGALSVVAADPESPDLTRDVRTSTGVRDVRIYIALPAAIQAAIARYYRGDLYAFARLDTAVRDQAMSLSDLYDKQVISLETVNGTSTTGVAERTRERVLTERDLSPDVRRSAAPGASPASTPGFADMVTVLVSLLENVRADLHGHSALSARWIRKLSERIGLAPTESDALAVAALLHDVGKFAPYHLTALNVAQYDSHRVVAVKSLEVPLRLFEGVSLGLTTLGAMRGMYERFDGKGVPDAVTGKDIPLGARLLAIADTYADLTHNPRNPYRRELSPAEACEVLAKYRGTVFDPNLLDILRQIVTGDDLRARILSDRPVVLLVDPDPEESTVLEIRMVEHGYDLRSARTIDHARKALEAGDVDLCIAETDIPGGSGIDLLAWARTQPWGRALPWIVLTRDARREAITRAYEIGVADYVVKPVPMEVLSAKIRHVVASSAASRSAQGVTGSLAEMALTDIVQMLSQARKSGQLKVRSGSEQGEIHFLDGAVYNAMWGTVRGEEAFYAMIAVTTGDFALDPAFRPGARVITATVESMMLEGMRRLDEAKT